MTYIETELWTGDPDQSSAATSAVEIEATDKDEVALLVRFTPDGELRPSLYFTPEEAEVAADKLRQAAADARKWTR